jgi:hypothetical protein
LEIRSHFFFTGQPGPWSFDFMLLLLSLGWHVSQFLAFSIFYEVSQMCLPGLASNLDSTNLSLPHR